MPRRAPAASHTWWLSPAHLLAVVRSLWGTLLLTRPRRVGQALGIELADAAPGRGVMRVLGGRHLGQAAVTVASPTAPVVGVGAVVDGVHALTALVWGVADRSHRRAGLTDAGLAAGFGIAGALVARNALSARGSRSHVHPSPAGAHGADASSLHQPLATQGVPRSAGTMTPVASTSPHAERPDPERATDSGESRDDSRTGTDRRDDRGRDDHPQSGRLDAQQPQAPVRPRVMWAGVGLAVLAMFGIGWAMVADSGVGEIVAVVALLVGAFLAWRGGVLNDVQSSQPMHQEVEAAVQGGEHSGVEAGDQLHDPEAQARAAQIHQRKAALLRSRVAFRGLRCGRSPRWGSCCSAPGSS